MKQKSEKACIMKVAHYKNFMQSNWQFVSKEAGETRTFKTNFKKCFPLGVGVLLYHSHLISFEMDFLIEPEARLVASKT